jgi:hypothetical protein
MLFGIFQHIRASNRTGDYFNASITLLFVLCSAYLAMDLCQQYTTLVLFHLLQLHLCRDAQPSFLMAKIPASHCGQTSALASFSPLLTSWRK